MAETNGHNGPPPAATPSAGDGNGSGNGGNRVAKVLAGAKAVQARATEELKETIKAP